MKILINLLTLILLPIILVSLIIDGVAIYRTSAIIVLVLYILFVENKYDRIVLSFKGILNKVKK
ncbi:MAG: hypothetical protein N4A57_03840 [Anaeromicrobium sp.]|jgi:hypothetical protein|uniref:hypothetical protein n=1 Tax=Anaeromicrobium sp. TaxID=1929132 RepID=UPI0025FA619B|nr:hypothetical protein [Anaeromicrobium sp.]MCT4593391.1 hypothetical protein [Anaeromicrobium sp.]